MSVKADLKEWIRNHFEIGSDPDYMDAADIFDLGFVDSFGAVEIVAHIEDEYRVEITQRDIVVHGMRTLDEIAAVVDTKLAK
ncbi:MAG: acyl carrier protein [Coriobacteriia bacterium]|nr:acyl carrier protein [Coriobacteriia bacterium]